MNLYFLSFLVAAIAKGVEILLIETRTYWSHIGNSMTADGMEVQQSGASADIVLTFLEYSFLSIERLNWYSDNAAINHA